MENDAMTKSIPNSRLSKALECQSAFNLDPLSASNFDPLSVELARRCVALI